MLSITPPYADPNAVQGRYARVATGNGGQTMRALAADPSVAVRIWAVGTSFGQVGISDDDGLSFTNKTANPDANSYGIQQLTFTSSHAWLLTGGNGSKQGRLFRSPLPNASGNSLVWTAMFDLAAPPNSLTAGVNSNFRNSCFASAADESAMYLVEYSGSPITGGPSLYYSADGGTNWSKPQTWANGKHAHAVKIIGGVPWVMIGDSTFTDLGLWCATTAAASSWSRRSLYGELSGGNMLYGINFFTMSIGGQTMIVAESDGHYSYGPLFFMSTSLTASGALLPLCTIYQPYVGTMRGLTLTSEGNLMWVTTGESGAVGPLDSIWISKPPFSTPVLCESFAAGTLGTINDSVERGSYVYFGTYRVTKELFRV